ncbi:hypothetical protein CA606_19680 [Caulobacter vibrioides]|uniref:Uncharacterized protein n=1 Tax=Caulobacter vibrioides TaxID=155892 RepID=A0A290MQU9_CAUVI|nr:hypothetical protein CA606_19680 [Caulobacter vibrioides]
MRRSVTGFLILRCEPKASLEGRRDAPSVSLRIRSDPPPPQAGQEGTRFLLTRIAGEVARRR